MTLKVIISLKIKLKIIRVVVLYSGGNSLYLFETKSLFREKYLEVKGESFHILRNKDDKLQYFTTKTLKYH